MLRPVTSDVIIIIVSTGLLFTWLFSYLFVKWKQKRLSVNRPPSYNQKFQPNENFMQKLAAEASNT